ncbi:MAG: hypothetical protein R3A45_08150 [Bdellovibrionota bacterium]
MSELGNSFIDVNARNFDDRAGVTDQRANEISRNILSHLPKQNHISILGYWGGNWRNRAYLCGQDRTYTCLEESKDMIAAFAKRVLRLG